MPLSMVGWMAGMLLGDLLGLMEYDMEWGLGRRTGLMFTFSQ